MKFISNSARKELNCKTESLYEIQDNTKCCRLLGAEIKFWPWVTTGDYEGHFVRRIGTMFVLQANGILTSFCGNDALSLCICNQYSGCTLHVERVRAYTNLLYLHKVNSEQRATSILPYTLLLNVQLRAKEILKTSGTKVGLVHI
jgi:hypothetical protein